MTAPVDVRLNKTISELSDEELAVLAISEKDNFLPIVERYQEKLLRYIRRISNMSVEDAEDVLQEVFIKVYLNLNDFDTDLKFSSWIYRIAHNQVISRYRHAKARPEGNAIDLDEGEAHAIVADLDLVRDVDRSLLRTKVARVLDRLDPRYREVLTLKYIDGRSYQEMSDIIERPIGTVASLLNKAKAAFEKELLRQEIKL